jgi:hypothetical protein
MTRTMLKQNPQYELRLLLFSLLDATILYKGAPIKIYEAVPRGMPRPYVVLGDCTWDMDDDKDAFGEDYILKVEIYTDYGGTLDNCAILNVVEEVISTAYNNNSLNFSSPSAFCISIFWFGHGDTRVLRAEETVAGVELEQTILDLQFRIKQHG